MSGRRPIVVTGASGFIGCPLVARLLSDGWPVVALTRDPARAQEKLGQQVRCVEASLEAKGAWTAELAGAHAVVHLAGEPLDAARWTPAVKQRIRDSRVETTATLVSAIADLPAEQRPTALIAASAIDIYPLADPKVGFEDDDIDEAVGPGDHFLGRLCATWEAEALEAEELGLRVVRMRTGLVLAERGGLVERLRPVYRKFLGGPLGSGRQWFSWIHLDDVVAAYAQAVADASWRGPVNLVAPQACRQREFAKAFAHSLGRPAIFPTPTLALRLRFPGLWPYLVGGRRVVPSFLNRVGYRFLRPSLPEALRT